MAKQKQTVSNPIFGQVSPLQGQLLRRGSNPEKLRAAISNLELLGGLDENVLATALQRSGSFREQDAILEAVQEGRLGRLSSGSGGKGSSTPHFRALPIEDTGDIIFESGGQQLTQHGAGPIEDTTGQSMPSFKSLFAEAGPSEAVLQERANRQAIEDELFTEQRARALGTIAGRTGADAQAARQILDIPATPGFEDLISPEQDQQIRQRRSEEAAQRARIEKWARLPTADQANIENLWQQHEQQYPEFSGGQRPQTLAEQMEQRQAAELATYQQAVPSVPLARNDKGVIGVIPGFSEARTAEVNALRMENDRLKQLERGREAGYQRELDVIKAETQFEPDPAVGAKKIRDLQQRIFPGGQPSATQPPAPADTPEQLPALDFQSGPSAESAFKAGRLKSDQPFTMGGKTFIFGHDGRARRAD